jgi:hypothetical protein
MSTKQDQFYNYLLNNGPVINLLDDLPHVPMPDGVFVCMVCKKVNEHFYQVCEDCEDPLGGDGFDD